MSSVSERKRAAREFSEKWADRGNERQDSQAFWLELLDKVYGIENPNEYIKFESSIHNMMDSTSFIDGYIDTTKVLIEQKGQYKKLSSGIKQSDGSLLTPFQQAKRYSANLPYSKIPRWIITSNFKEFYIYDMEKPNAKPSIVELANLEDEYYRLEILVDKTSTKIEKETEVSIKAGELIGEIYDELMKQYLDPESPVSHHSINQLSVRLVFCFYADDAGLFGKRGMFKQYLENFDFKYFRNALIDLFDVLNTKPEERDPYLLDDLAAFPFVNGGLFAEADIEIPRFTDELIDLILKHASSSFDWSEISPTVFGGVFESTINPEQRREGGMHYTSIENIHKLIDPLFLDDLKEELNEIKQLKQYAAIKRRAASFQDKLSNLSFFDPACGSGNFLTETYIALRELENESLKLIHRESMLNVSEHLPVKVTLDQFYGIEINDFAVSVATTALWIAEIQMFEKTKDILFSEEEYLPITSSANVIVGNALSYDWEELVPKEDLDYIIGNPPFIGARLMSSEQKQQIKTVFNNQKKVGNLDYVAAWYRLAAEYMQGTEIESAFVSTNSITQGEQVAILWEPLMRDYDVKINFAYQTFFWKSESSDNAAVHVVIVSFSSVERKVKNLYLSNEQVELVDNINGYLVDAPNLFIQNRRNPISNVPKIRFGSMANDDQNLILKPEERDELIKQFPQSSRVIKKFVGAQEFINDLDRYCLWITSESLALVSKIPPIMEKLEAVKKHRLSSPRKATQKLAETPYAFGENRQPETDYLLIPKTSSENRRYIPIGYMGRNEIASDATLIIPEAKLWHFAILSSNVHMSWMRQVAGRLESRYRYSAQIVYNNFPWPELSYDQKRQLNDSANNILKARAMYLDSSLAELYNELIMPPELRKAHQDNDRLVMTLYDMVVGQTTETDSVAKVFELHNQIVNQM